MYLIDSNIWLESLLSQEQADQVQRFLAKKPSSELYITDFALHSIGVILTKLGEYQGYIDFIDDLFSEGQVQIIHLIPGEMERVINVQSSR